MAIKFDGRRIRDEILASLKNKVASFSVTPTLAVIWVGQDTVSARYIEQKQRAAEFLGLRFDIYKYPNSVSNEEIELELSKLNISSSVAGIVIQLPLPRSLDQERLIEKINIEKDIDGLRFCSDLSYQFRPPVIAAIMEAIKISSSDIKSKRIAIVGRGFLVGSPLIKYLGNRADVRVADDQAPYLGTITSDADIIISAVGKPGLITPELVKKSVILIDAGTAEVGGELRGDVDPRCYETASFYTPVPGGIGPVTVAMLFKNLIEHIHG